jgi:hypothetical protein
VQLGGYLAAEEEAGMQVQYTTPLTPAAGYTGGGRLCIYAVSLDIFKRLHVLLQRLK